MVEDIFTTVFEDLIAEVEASSLVALVTSILADADD